MKRAIALLLLLATVAPAAAQTERRARSDTRFRNGLILVLVGTGSVAAAFDYRRDCDGYRSTYRGRSSLGNDYDFCTTVSSRHVHTEETPWTASLKRKPCCTRDWAP